jgi:chromate transporter
MQHEPTAAPASPSPAPGVHAALPPAPSLGLLFWVFLAVGMQSFGGGLSGWIRREAVQRRGWMSEQQFASGLALCQITPGPNAVNLAVFIGATLRGRAGAFASVGGIIGLPMLVAIALGAGFALIRDAPAAQSVMEGVGAAAIGFNFATGLRMVRRNVRTAEGALVAIAAALAVGIFGLNFPLVLAVLVPVSIALAAWRTS